MSKNWTHDLLIFKGAFETGEIKDVKEQENTFSSRWDVEKVEIFGENWIFSFMKSSRVLSKGEIKDEQIEHILLSVRWEKSWNLLRKFDSVMIKNWTHDLPIFKGAFERVNQGCKRANRTHFALGQMRKKLKSSEKIWFFHSVMSKNWTHDLPIFKGAFERGNQGCKRANRTHFALGQMSKKLKSSEKIWFFHSVMSKN